MLKQQVLIRKCQGCGGTYRITVYEDDLIAWENGAFIQSVMPYLSADERELLISGFCGDCFAKMFETV